MKRNLLLIAGIISLFAACAEKETLKEVNYGDEPTLIAFDTYHSKSTKAPIFTEVDLISSNGGFGVYAFKHEANIPLVNKKVDLSNVAEDYTNPVFDNTKVWYNEAYNTNSEFFQKYEYEVPRYWDKQLYYTFFAYAPITDVITDTTSTSTQKGIFLDPATGWFLRTDVHEVQCASSPSDKVISSTVTRDQYDIDDDNIKDYLLAPCAYGQKWHETNQSSIQYLNNEITVGFVFSHILSQLNVNINVQKEYSDSIANDTLNGHEYKGIENIYVTKLEIENLPTLLDTANNYTFCQQQDAYFAQIYGNSTLKFTNDNYSTTLKIVDQTTENSATTYKINGGAASANPLYLLDGGTTITASPAGSLLTDGYIDHKFRYYIVPSTATADGHDLNIGYSIKYVDGKTESFKRTIHLAEAPFNFTKMDPSFIYNVYITISLDQIYITVDDVEWDSDNADKTQAPRTIVVPTDDL